MSFPPCGLVLQQHEVVPGLFVELGQKFAVALAAPGLLLVAVIEAAFHLDDEVMEDLADPGTGDEIRVVVRQQPCQSYSMQYPTPLRWL